MMRIVAFIILAFLVPYSNSFGQSILKIEDFLTLVGQNHPIGKMAEARISQSLGEILAAKGAFDPTLYVENSKKTLDGKNYYNYTNPELKVQTPLGFTLKTGVEASNGLYLSPEKTNGTLSYLGLEISVLKGLLLDRQRADLKQAQLFLNETNEAKRVIINNLYLDASYSYWQWAGTKQSLDIFTRSLENAENRFRLIKIAFNNGDRAMADTLEALTQVQNIQLLQSEALMDYQKASIDISRFIWSESVIPSLLDEKLIPDNQNFNFLRSIQNLNELINNANINHPELTQYKYKIGGLEIEKRLMAQSLLPQLDLKANLLSPNYYNFGAAYSPILANNYKFGFDFKFPLLIREGRGKLQKADFKLQEANFGLTNKNWEIENKIRQADTELKILNSQIATVFSLTNNYEALLRNEVLKFNQGESSLFIINSRENKYLEGQIKLQSLKIKYHQTWVKQQWAAGILGAQ